MENAAEDVAEKVADVAVKGEAAIKLEWVNIYLFHIGDKNLT